MSTTISLILSVGPLGVGIRDVDSQCVVYSKNNVKAPLEIGDTILSLNGITLSEVEGGLDAWKTLFSTFAHGTRTVIVQRSARDYYQSVKPQRTLSDNIFKLFGDENSSDVAFKVKRNVFLAHKLILKANAPELAELAEQFNMQTRMPIEGVEPAIFEMMLKSLYGRSIPASTWKEHSKQILDASGKYGFTELREEAERWHVKNLKLTVDNAVDQLLHADGTHCLMLKRAVIDYIVDNGQAVLASPSFAGLVESPELMKEIMVELAKSNESRKRKLGD